MTHRLKHINVAAMKTVSQAIEERQREAESLRARLASIESEIETLQQAAKLMGITTIVVSQASPTAVQASPGVKKRVTHGRKEGAISMQWRTILQNMYVGGKRYDFEEIQLFAGEANLALELPSVRERMRKFATQGYVEGDAKDGFSVTEEAATRFGFPKREGAPEGAPKPEEEGVAPPDSSNINP